jgi:tetratricopeptide (TPR) repeat protein
VNVSISVIRWILLAEGWLLLLGPGALAQALASLALNANQGMPEGLEGVDPEQLRDLTRMLAKLMVALMGIGVLCLASSWGIKRNKVWAKWTGMAAGVLQLPGFPLFTIAGGAVAWGLWNWEPVEEQKSAEGMHPDDQENPVITGIRTAATFILLILACSQLYRFTGSLGLPRTNLGDFGIVYLFAGQFVVTILHELGHLFAALTVGFRFQVINVGPITVYKDARGRRAFDFNIKRIFSHSGFLGAIPKTEENLRSNMAMIVFAGPFVSLNVAALLFLWMLNTPGTGFEPYGEIIGYAAVIFGLDFVANLIPLGHCDGSMLLGLAFNNARGKKIVSALIAAMHGDRAEVAAGEGSIEEQVSARKKAIEATRELNGGSEQSAHSVQSYVQLGLAELQAGDFGEAEKHLNRSLQLCDGMKTAVHPVIRAAACDGLARTYQKQSRYKESRAAGEQAIEIYEQCKAEMPSMDGLLEIYFNIADLQLALRQFGDAVMTAEQAVGSLPGGARNALMTARLYRVHAAALMGGKSAQAATSVRRAAKALEGSTIPMGHRIDAYGELLALSTDLWTAGSDAAAIELAAKASSRLTALGASADVVNRARLIHAEMLTKSGRAEEAAAVLETVDGVGTSAVARKILLSTRGELQLRMHRMEEALQTYTDLMQMETDAKDAASVKVALALVHESMQNAEEAQSYAREACNTLVPIEHPDAAEALFTLSRAMWAAGDENAEAYFEEGRRILGENGELTPANKARMVETAIPRFEESKMKYPTEMLKRDAAQFRALFPSLELAAPAAPGAAAAVVAAGAEDEESESSEVAG